MTNKQKIIKYLEPYRDKTLSEGCMVRVVCPKGDNNYSDWVFIGEPDIYDNQTTLWFCEYSTFSTTLWGNFTLENKDYDIIGHPLTPMDLLRALIAECGEDKWLEFDAGEDLAFMMTDEIETRTDWITVPLTTRTLEDIPEDDPLWDQLVKIFNL